ncbi:MAG: hypothetical protein OEM52_01540 [bacterium]|nr:hypothetical protein [bacterium]
MPTYVYECETDPSHTYEKMQRFSDATDTVCPTCGGPVHRVITGGVGLIFNGKGFYQTDYKGGNPSLNGTTKPAKAEAKSEASSETSSTDSKPTGGCGAGCSCHH